VETLDALWGQVREGMTEVPRIDRANPSTGPISVDGVQPGQVLAIDILGIDLIGKGYLTFGGRPRFFDCQGSLIEFGPGIRLAAAPMIGTIGLMPAAGSFSTMVSGNYGGNMDVRDVGPGATLYLTVQVQNGLLAMGDVHSLQADGETSGQGIETAAEITLRVRVLPGGLSSHPYLVRQGELIVIRSAESLQEAASQAVEEMALIVATHGELTYDEARMLVGLVGDLRVGQIVCSTKTVKVVLPLSGVPWDRPLLL